MSRGCISSSLKLGGREVTHWAWVRVCWPFLRRLLDVLSTSWSRCRFREAGVADFVLRLVLVLLHGGVDMVHIFRKRHQLLHGKWNARHEVDGEDVGNLMSLTSKDVVKREKSRVCQRVKASPPLIMLLLLCPNDSQGWVIDYSESLCNSA